MLNGSTTISYIPGGADDPANRFHYSPSMGAAVLFLIIFILTFIALSTWTICTRSWYMFQLLIACQMEFIGYGTRIPFALNPIRPAFLYGFMYGPIIMAPLLNAANQYVLLNRLIHAVGDQCSLMKPKLFSWSLLICNVISQLVQTVGVGILISASINSNTAKIGENIILAGFVINLASFAIFCPQLFYFDYCTRKSSSAFPSGGLLQKGWRQLLYVIYLSSFLVMFRQIYRVIEFAQGSTGYLAVHEIYLYVFDALPIFIATAIYVIIFPGNGYLPGHRSAISTTIENKQQNLRTENETIIVEKL